MDARLALQLEAEFRGKPVGGWTIERLLGNGNSAAVFKARRDDTDAAIKLFDKDFLGPSAKHSQLERIRRELALRGKYHPNLVRIFDGGECPETGYLYVVMEYLPKKTLAQVLQSVPPDRVWPIVQQISSAAQFLWEQGETAHRDITIDNVVIDDAFECATLLDLGVVKPLRPDQEDENVSGGAFLGTKRYAPPEFLFGQAPNSADAFLAITFYQLGALLYDLMKRERLFAQFQDNQLLWAILNHSPDFTGVSAPESLILLARDCLAKDPESRLRFVSWSRFANPEPQGSKAGSALARIALRRGPGSVQQPDAEQYWAATVVAQDVVSMLGRALKKASHENRDLPRIACHETAPKDGRCFLMAELEPPNPDMPLHRVYLGIAVTIEDPTAKACEISYQGIVSTRMLSEEHFEGEYNAVLHRGAVGKEMVERFALELVATVVDYCQTQQLTSELHRIPPGFIDHE